MKGKNLHQGFPQKRFPLGKEPRLKGEIKITELSPALRFILLKQNKLPKKQKCDSKSDLKENIAIRKQINKLLCGIKLLLKSNFYSLGDKSQTNEFLLESAFRLLLIILILLLLILILILLLYILLLPFASGISLARQIWQQLLQFLFGSGPG
jgi:hypothetical protein